MKLGAWGSIALTPQVLGEDGRYRAAPTGRKADRWRARTKVRDLDGRMRDVERYGGTKPAAQRILLEHLLERVTPAPADAEIKPTTLLRDAAEVYRAEMRGNDRLAIN